MPLPSLRITCTQCYLRQKAVTSNRSKSNVAAHIKVTFLEKIRHFYFHTNSLYRETATVLKKMGKGYRRSHSNKTHRFPKLFLLLGLSFCVQPRKSQVSVQTLHVKKKKKPLRSILLCVDGYKDTLSSLPSSQHSRRFCFCSRMTQA